MADLSYIADPSQTLNALAGGLQFGQRVKAIQDQAKINQLAGQAYQGDQSAIGQIAAVDPGSAQQIDRGLGQFQDRQQATLVNAARLLASAPDEAKPAIYQQMRQGLAQYIPNLPQEYGPEVANAANSIVQAWGGAGQAGAGVQSTYVDDRGQRIAVMRDGSVRVLGNADPRTQLRDQQGLAPGIVNLRTGQISPLTESAPPQQGTNGAYTIDPSIPPEVQAQIRAAESSGHPLPQNLGLAAARPEMSQAEAQRLALAQNADARAAQQLGLSIEASQRADRAERRQESANAITGRAPAEGERNAAGFYGRMQNAEQILDQISQGGYDATNPRDRTALSVAAGGGPLGGLANSQVSQQGQNYHQAAMDWVRAKLRKESGAAIGKDEARQEYENYFPVYGDSQTVIAQKARARAQATEAMRQAGGRAVQSTQATPQQTSGSDYSNLWK